MSAQVNFILEDFNVCLVKFRVSQDVLVYLLLKNLDRKALKSPL